MVLNISHTDTRLPAYVQLRDDFASKIASGDWAVDERIPSEAMLAKQYGSSVGTVRKAVDGLVLEGLLERRQGSGTFIKGLSFDSTLFRFFQVRDINDQRSLTIPNSELILRARVVAPKEVAEALDTENVIQILRVRGISNQPILFEKIFIPTSIFDGFEAIPDKELGPLLYPVYLKHFGILIHKAVDDLSFGNADKQVSHQLNLEAGAPVAIIKRTAYSRDKAPVEWRIAFGNAAHFRYRSEIT